MPNPTESQNIIDRAIEAAFPGWAARRVAARGALATYRGAVATRTGQPWGRSTSYRGGTQRDRRDLASMRDRARRVYRENPVGRSILNTETDNVVADGFELQAKTADAAFNKEAEERWYEWLEVADYRRMLCGADLQRQAYLSPRRDGDGGVVLANDFGDSRLQFLPGDRIQQPYGRMGQKAGLNGNDVLDGVEVDPAGRPVAFHVLDETEAGRRQWARIPADDFVYLLPDMDDDLGVRGVTCYATVFGDLDGLDGYKDAVILAARMACVFGLIFKTKNPAAQAAGLSLATNAAGQQQYALTLENGQAKYVGQGDDVAQVQAQQPMQQTPDFIRAQMRLIGVPFDMPLELIAKDMSTVNFASARIGLLGYYRACRVKQNRFARRFLDRVYRWWLSRERKRQALGYADTFVTRFPDRYWDHVFLPRAWDYTDPVSEAQSDLLQIDMGTKSPQMVAAERGRDWELIQEELAAARAFRKLRDLPTVHSTMTRHPQLGVGAQGDPLGNEQVLPAGSTVAADPAAAPAK